MNKKQIIIIGILVVCIIVVGIFLIIQKNQNQEINEIEPAEEITEEQMRSTIVTLYYQNKETKELMPEGRMVDAKELLTNPYVVLTELLAGEPKNEKLQTVIPSGTKVLKAELKGDIVYLDLSNEFIDNHTNELEAENNTINAIVNTLTELNEVNGVKILIKGQENKSFKDEKINFKEVFKKINSTNSEQENKNEITNKQL